MRLSSRHGFTIIEVLIASILVLIACIITTDLIGGAWRLQSRAAIRSEGFDAAQDSLSEIRAIDNLTNVRVDTALATAGENTTRANYSDGTELTGAGGIDPVVTVGRFTVYRFVYCLDTGDADCVVAGRELPRRIRIVIEASGVEPSTPGGLGTPLETVIGGGSAEMTE